MPSKHSHVPVTVPRRSRTRPQTSKSLTAGLHRLAHQIVNQLTVINLSCFKLRTALKNAAPAANIDIERLEKAVADMNVLVEALSQLEEQTTAPRIATNPTAGVATNTVPANVYPLFETKKPGG